MIRKAQKEDMPRILEIYEIAREYMRNSGNPNQWGDNHPEVSKIENNLNLGQLYVYENNNRILGVFALIFGEDETYSYIEGGNWLNDEPYVTMHMVASSGEEKGIFDRFCNFAKEKCDNVRIDTHRENLTMQHCILKHGFSYCGVIYLLNGDPRLAYHWKK